MFLCSKLNKKFNEHRDTRCATLQHIIISNTELNDLSNIICLRKSEVSVERISVCNVIKILCQSYVMWMLFGQGNKYNSSDLWCRLIYNSKGA